MVGNATIFNLSMYDRMVDNMMFMIAMSVITPLVTVIITGFGKHFTDTYMYVVGWLKGIFGPKIYSVTINRTMTYSSEKSHWTSVPEESQNGALIFAILMYMEKHSLCSDKMLCHLGQGKDFKDVDVINYEKSRTIEYIPVREVVYGDFTFTYVQHTQDGTDKSIEKRLNSITISSKKSTRVIQEFIRKCYEEYVDDKLKCEDETKYYYKQIPSKEGVRFKKYPICNRTTFDKLYFPEKSKILELVDKLSSGEIHKLSLLLHGTPGCGKTSVIKALAKQLGYSIIEVKLSFMINDAALGDVFHNKAIIYHQHNDEKFGLQTDIVPLNKRIYIFEDVDAECDVILQRSSNDKPLSNEVTDNKKVAIGDVSKEFFDKIMNKWLKKGLTLSGILNVFDGVLEINGAVIVMTTNHPDKLDDAFKRPGRITLSIEMKKMLASEANKMVYQKYGEKLDNIRDMVFTPALLESYCQISTNINELRSLVDEYQQKQIINV